MSRYLRSQTLTVTILAELFLGRLAPGPGIAEGFSVPILFGFGRALGSWVYFMGILFGHTLSILRAHALNKETLSEIQAPMCATGIHHPEFLRLNFAQAFCLQVVAC